MLVSSTLGRGLIIIGGNLLNVGVVGLYLTCQALSPALYVVRVLHGVAGTMLYSSLQITNYSCNSTAINS